MQGINAIVFGAMTALGVSGAGVLAQYGHVAVGAEPETGERVEGKVTVVDHANETFTVTDGAGVSRDVAVDDDTRYTVDGAPASATDVLRVGTHVEAKVGEDDTALRVDRDGEWRTPRPSGEGDELEPAGDDLGDDLGGAWAGGA